MEPVQTVVAPTAPEIKVPPQTDGVKVTALPEGGEKAPGIKEGEEKQTNAAPQNPDRPYKIKVNGREMDVSLDELKTLAQKAESAEQRFLEAGKMRKQSQTLVRLLKENPLQVLSDPRLGIDIKKIAQDFLYAEIQKEQMTPEQRELHDTKQKLAEMEEEKKTSQKKIEDERFQELVKHHSTQLDKEISAALQTANLPKSPTTIKRVAFYMMEGLKRGVELKASDVMDIVRNDYISDFRDMFGLADGETMTKVLGDEVVKKLREYDLNRLRPDLATRPAQTQPTAPKGKVEKLDPMDWRDRLEKKFA
jgi:hypothetical protein